MWGQPTRSKDQTRINGGGTAVATPFNPCIFLVQVTLCALNQRVMIPLKNDVTSEEPSAVIYSWINFAVTRPPCVDPPMKRQLFIDCGVVVVLDSTIQ